MNAPAKSVPEDIWRFHDMDEFFKLCDKFFQAKLAKLTLGMSPAALGTAFVSWYLQLLQSPGHLLQLGLYPALHSQDFYSNIICSEKVEERDIRFVKDSWQSMPWRGYAHLFLQLENWWRLATTNLDGLPKHVERTVYFCIRQILDAISPSNFILTNPDLYYETLRLGGVNIINGTRIAIQDTLEKLTGVPPAGVRQFMPGKHVAITPGQVVFRNHLIELIQYEAQTKSVYKEPLLILPAWIMKYYILDLSPDNSLVRWLVEQGHTVFIVSWRNPSREDRNLSMDDYYRLGAMAAIDQVYQLSGKPVHLMGYCLGGTLAMLTAAAMARAKDKRLKTLSLLAAQGDFREAGELMLFITRSEVAYLKNMMWDQGYLDTKQMAGTFQMLRSYDLIWSKMTQDYMHGKERGMIDLLAWNADTTRMPYKMHSEYLEKLFLNNDFAEGRYKIEENPVVAENIHLPAFVVSTEKDHVAPWRSVYKTHLLINSDLTFILASGGHNAGIVSSPALQTRSYRIHERKHGDVYLDSNAWLNIARKRQGSWWLAWHEWLINNSSVRRVRAPTIKNALMAAPGSYILQK